VFGDDSSSNFDNGKLLRRNRTEVGQVLLDFPLRTNIAQELYNSRPSREAV
jgi:hypothetical protein